MLKQCIDFGASVASGVGTYAAMENFTDNPTWVDVSAGVTVGSLVLILAKNVRMNGWMGRGPAVPQARVKRSEAPQIEN